MSPVGVKSATQQLVSFRVFWLSLIIATDSSFKHYLKKKKKNIFDYLFTYLVKTYMTTLEAKRMNLLMNLSYSIFPEPAADCCYLSYAEFRMPASKSITSIGNLKNLMTG